MKTRIVIVSLCGFILLPSCMSPMQQALRTRQEQQRAVFENNGHVAMGASDAVGQSIAGNLFSGRLTLDVTSEVSSTR